MRYEQHKIMEGSNATITLYLHELHEQIKITKRPIILVIPGGGYGHVSEREADSVAVRFYNMGYHAAILRYSILEGAKNMQPMKEGILAIKFLRENADEFSISADAVAVCGFSAGGHLACSLGTMWNEPKLMDALSYDDDRYKPDAMILCYPVISSGEYAHRGSFENLTGSPYDDEVNAFFSLEKRVDKNTPPAFIWHTQTDGAVPVQNTLMFVNELQKNNVSYELHIFRNGGHGMSVCTKETDSAYPHCEHWMELCHEWLEETFGC